VRTHSFEFRARGPARHDSAGHETIQPQSNRKEHAVAESVPEEPVWVEGDPLRLEQVIVNLLNNAVKYTDAGGHIQVTLRRQGHEALLHVCDDGVGIAPGMLPRIFDLFTQADRSLDRAQGGWVLDLPWCIRWSRCTAVGSRRKVP
jgi:signal transduction histidine kinase